MPSTLATSHLRFLEQVAAELLLRDPDGSRLGRVDDTGPLAEDAAEQAIDTASTWEAHLGGFLDVDGVRRLLSRGGRPVSKQAVSQRRGLLALTTGSGRVVYPRVQFTSGAPTPGLEQVLAVLPEALVSRWTVASWLVSPQVELGGEAPLTVLRDGATAPVLAAARAWARSLAA